MSHYQQRNPEPIDITEAWGLNFNLGNVMKYVGRAGLKTEDPQSDLEKAMQYLYREIHGEWMPKLKFVGLLHGCAIYTDTDNYDAVATQLDVLLSEHLSSSQASSENRLD